MRKTCLALACSMLFCAISPIKGQTQQGMSEIRLQVSDGFPLALINSLTIGLSDAFSSAFSDYTIKREGESSVPGLWGIAYRYYVTPRFSVGLDAGYMQYSASYSLKKSDDEREGERKTKFIVALPTAEYSYLNKEKVQLYGNIGLGLTSMSGHSTVSGDGSRYDYSAASFAFQLNPIGVRFGQRFGGFAELGFGFKGFFTAGFSARL